MCRSSSRKYVAFRSCLLSSCLLGAGIIKSTALRGGKEVVTDERATVGLEVTAASVPQLQQKPTSFN